MTVEKSYKKYSNGRSIIYKVNGSCHREDGPSIIREFNDGTQIEIWCKNNQYHRYGAPALIHRNGEETYWIRDNLVNREVHEWLLEMGYPLKWSKMTDIEKWELEMFMRSI